MHYCAVLLWIGQVKRFDNKIILAHQVGQPKRDKEIHKSAYNAKQGDEFYSWKEMAFS